MNWTENILVNNLQNIEPQYSYLFLFNWYDFKKEIWSFPHLLLSRWSTDQGNLHIRCCFIFTSLYVRTYQFNRYLLNSCVELLVTIGATETGCSSLLSECSIQTGLENYLDNYNIRWYMTRALQKVL